MRDLRVATVRLLRIGPRRSVAIRRRSVAPVDGSEEHWGLRGHPKGAALTRGANRTIKGIRCAVLRVRVVASSVVMMLMMVVLSVVIELLMVMPLRGRLLLVPLPPLLLLLLRAQLGGLRVRRRHCSGGAAAALFHSKSAHLRAHTGWGGGGG